MRGKEGHGKIKILKLKISKFRNLESLGKLRIKTTFKKLDWSFMRKSYLDNLRILMILLLFPIHTFMIWNDFGTRFYIWNGKSKLLSTLIVLVNPWFMPLLFVIAGICARFSLEKRSTKEFIGERVSKLLIPFVSGMILLVPIQTLYARKFFYGYEGGIIANYKYFFTHLTDLSGYDGGFTPGHLWFILFLFLISLIFLIFHKYFPYPKVKYKIETMNLWLIIGLFLPIWLFYYVGNFSGFSIGKDLALYLAGYYVLSNASIIKKLEENIKWIAWSYCILQIALGIAYYQYSYYGDLVVNLIGWLGILFWLILGKRHFNQDTKVTRYLKKASFPIYILHQSILVVWGYYIMAVCKGLFLQVIIIMLGSFILTVICYQMIRYIPYLRNLLGIR